MSLEAGSQGSQGSQGPKFYTKIETNNLLNKSLPIGAILLYPMLSANTEIPMGYVMCDGAEVPKIGKFNALYNLFGGWNNSGVPLKDPNNNFRIVNYMSPRGYYPNLVGIIKYANLEDLMPIVSENYTSQYFGVF